MRRFDVDLERKVRAWSYQHKDQSLPAAEVEDKLKDIIEAVDTVG